MIIKGLFNKLSDKQKHMIVGFMCGFAYFPFQFFFDFNTVAFANLFLSSVLFIGKEICDKYKPNPTGFDVVDLFADYLGWGVGVWVGSVILIAIKCFIL